MVDSIEIPVQAVAPTIDSISPEVLIQNVADTLTISGTGFYPGMTVEVGTQMLVPTTITPTSLTVDVGAESIATLAVDLEPPERDDGKFGGSQVS